MGRIKQVLLGMLVLLSGLWLGAEQPWAGSGTFFAVRNMLVNYTGVLAMGMMSVGMVLAARPVWLETAVGGLDKMYRLHKWLGIGGLGLALSHWVASNGPKWAIGWGLMQRPSGGRPPHTQASEWIFQVFQRWHGTAEGVGEWAFYATVLMVVLALVKWFPYRAFFKTHRILAVTYLLLVGHGVVLMSFGYWASPLGVFMAWLMAAGSVSAVLVLVRRVGARRKLAGEIERVEYFESLQVLSVTLHIQGGWAGHAAGQFAYVTLDDSEGAHPFTIASAWEGDGRITFLIKALGDYTRQLPAQLRPGQQVQLEGPYGRFNFESPKRRQIWVGAGIGITPFVARMKALGRVPDGRAVDLFHCTTVEEPLALQKMQADAQASGVQLHVLVDARDGRLDAPRITTAVPRWRDADVWFCGPPALGKALRTMLVAQGLAPMDFHQELFQMR